MINKIIKKLVQRFKELKNHPIGKDAPIYNLFRYSQFHLKSRFKQELVYPWIGELKFIARRGDAGIVGNIYFGLDEFNESVFLLHFLLSQDVFFDVGANLGHYSLLASGINKCSSFAIEPVPESYNQLLNQIELNSLQNLITPLKIGVSDKIGSLYFSTDRGTMNRIVSPDYKNAVSVQVETIDSLSMKFKMPIAMKLDVEGFEKSVLLGASSVLGNPCLKVLVVELNNSGENFGSNNEEVSKYISSFGFKPYSYNPYTRKLILLDNYNKKSFNTIFIRDELFVFGRIKDGAKVKIRTQTI